MLERYFVKPSTLDRVRGSWIAPAIEQYVASIVELGYSARFVQSRVPLLVTFGDFSRDRGATSLTDLPALIGPFVSHRVAERAAYRADGRTGPTLAKDLRIPIEQMLCVTLPGFEPTGRRHHPTPFASAVPDFFAYLVEERGLRPASIEHYRHHLDRFEAYLGRIGIQRLDELSPVVLSSYVVERAGSGLARSSVRDSAGVLRVFLRYAHRQGVLSQDLRRGRLAPGLPARDPAAFDLMGRREQCPRRSRSTHGRRPEGLRDSPLARRLWAAGPGGRVVDARRYRLEAGEAGDPRA